MIVVLIFATFLAPVFGISTGCYFKQTMVEDKDYYIYNREYPSLYKNAYCVWEGYTGVMAQVVLQCTDVNITKNANCTKDRLSISIKDNDTVKHVKNFCGNMPIFEVYKTNYILIELYGPQQGRFSCVLTGQYYERTNTTATTQPTKQIQSTLKPTVATPTIFRPTIASTSKPTPASLTTFKPTNTTSTKEQQCYCNPPMQVRIVGGTEAKMQSYPFMAALMRTDQDVKLGVWCGGVIISRRHVLSAAQCAPKTGINYFVIRVGVHNITSKESTEAGMTYFLEDFFVHPNFNPKTNENNIMAVKTLTPIRFNFYVSPVCLPFNYYNEMFVNETVTIMGWGTTGIYAKKSEVLLETDVKVVANSKCQEVYGRNQTIYPSNICTYAPKKDFCFNDVGGPVVWYNSKRSSYLLVGIASHGEDCGSNFPGVSVRVTSMLYWIQNVTREDFCAQ